jgi:putative transposase
MQIQKAPRKKPKDGSPHWSVRAAAAESGIPKSSVQRQYQTLREPHCTKSFKLSNDASFIEAAARDRRVVFEPSRQRPAAVSE